MKNKLLSLCLVTHQLVAFAPHEDFNTPILKDPKEIINYQLQGLDVVIDMTTLSLNQLHILRRQVNEYKLIQERYLEHIEDKKLLREMLQAADALQKQIFNDNFSALFDTEFMAELKTLSKVYQKMQLPRQ